MLAEEANVVIATCRNPANAKSLQEVVKPVSGRAHIVPLDVNKDESIGAAAKVVTQVVGGRGLNYVLNNAGIMVRILLQLHIICWSVLMHSSCVSHQIFHLGHSEGATI